MQYTIPHYFEDFKCVAAECEDTCCAGWAIMIDEDSLDRYKNMQGTFGNRVRNSIDWENGSFLQYEKRCAFLNDENLCDLHLEVGEHMLCNTCRDYPRHMEEFEGVREGSLSLSCIEAAKLILGCNTPVQFLRFEDEVEDEEYEDFDYLLYTKLTDARDKIISVLQNRDIDIMVRISMVLKLTDDIQGAIDDDEIFRIDDVLENFGDMNQILEFQKQSEDYQMGENEYCATMRKMFRVFSKLEVLKNDWPEYIKKAEFILYADGQSAYENKRCAFHKAYGLESEQHEKWCNWLEQLMVYFIFTYYCGAVYDGNVLGKMQTAVVATILIQELSIAKWKEKNGEFGFEDIVDIAHRVSREVEHSDVNLIRLEKIYEKTEIFHADKLLGVLLRRIE